MFDPTKPIDHCLYKGKKLAVKNRRETVEKNYPIAVYVEIRPDEWQEICFALNGNNLSGATGEFQLVNGREDDNGR